MAVVDRSLSTFAEVGRALAELHDTTPPLYRVTHATFETFCRDRWGMTSRFAQYQMQAAKVVRQIGTKVPKELLPQTETQARAIAPLIEKQGVDAAVEVLKGLGPDTTARAIAAADQLHVFDDQAYQLLNWVTVLSSFSFVG